MKYKVKNRISSFFISKKILAILMIMILCVGIFIIPTYADTTSQDGLEINLTTDKEVYEQGENIESTLTVINTSDKKVINVSLENLIPQGYQLGEGFEMTKEIDALAKGESITLKVNFVSEIISHETEESTEGMSNTDGSDNTTNEESSAVETRDSNNIGWYIVSMLFGVIILAIVFGKNLKQMMSLVLCVITATGLFVGVSVTVNAAEIQEGMVSISENVTVGNSDLIISAVVKYSIEVEEEEEIIALPKPENPSSADDYYWDTSIVIEVISAEESDDVFTEAELKTVLEERGFIDYPITYSYSIKGEYVSETKLIEESTEKHPMYQTFYLSEDGQAWMIYIINGEIFANPLSFNLESNLSAQLLVSESQTLTSYDDETNKFYINIPYESTVIVKTIDRIDAETLEKLVIEEND